MLKIFCMFVVKLIAKVKSPMTRINYTKTYFNPPSQIKEEKYNYLNNQLKLNPKSLIPLE